MTTPSACPDCGERLKPRASSCPCGWKAPVSASRAGAVAGPYVDPFYGCCAWESGGQRCRYPGTVAHSIHGGGPYYCSAHFHNADPLVGGQIVDESIRDFPSVPDYSVDGRRASIFARWRAEEEARRAADGGRYGGPSRLDPRAAVDETVSHLTSRGPG